MNKNNQLFQYLSNRIEAAVSQSCKIVTLDLGQISEIDSGTADFIKNSLNFVKKSGADAAILNANVSFAYSKNLRDIPYFLKLIQDTVTAILHEAGAGDYFLSRGVLPSESIALIES